MPTFVNPTIPILYISGSTSTYTEAIPVSPTIGQIFRVGASSPVVELTPLENRLIRYTGLIGSEQQYEVLTAFPGDKTINNGVVFTLDASGQWEAVASNQFTQTAQVISQNLTATTITTPTSAANITVRSFSFHNSAATTALWVCLFNTASPVSGVTVPSYVLRNTGAVNTQGFSGDLSFLISNSWSIRFSSTPSVFTAVTASQPIFTQLIYTIN